MNMIYSIVLHQVQWETFEHAQNNAHMLRIAHACSEVGKNCYVCCLQHFKSLPLMTVKFIPVSLLSALADYVPLVITRQLRDLL